MSQFPNYHGAMYTTQWGHSGGGGGGALASGISAMATDPIYMTPPHLVSSVSAIDPQALSSWTTSVTYGMNGATERIRAAETRILKLEQMIEWLIANEPQAIINHQRYTAVVKRMQLEEPMAANVQAASSV